MPLALIPTDDSMIIPGITEEYARRGYEVVVGVRNFFLKLHHADLVHVQWPEELSGWRLPSSEKMDEIRRAVDWWSETCPLIVSVNNFYPHGFDHHPVMKGLYEIFYQRASVILHYSEISRNMVLKEFPGSRGKANVVANYFCYDRLLSSKPDREKHRCELGFSTEEFVVLVFGALRFRGEVELIQKAFRGARVRGKRLLMAGRYVEETGKWLRRWRSLNLKLWLKSHRALTVGGHIPDDEVHKYLEAADAIIVPRLKDMTSGLVGLGLTFGLPIIAPNHGAYPEYLQGTDNPLYQSGDAEALAKAIEKAAMVDRERIYRQNRQLAEAWSWKSLIDVGLSALD